MNEVRRLDAGILSERTDLGESLMRVAGVFSTVLSII